MAERQDISLYTDPAERCSARLARLYGLSSASPYRGEEASHPRCSRHPLSGIFSRLFVAKGHYSITTAHAGNGANPPHCSAAPFLFPNQNLTNLTLMSRSRRSGSHPCGGPFSGIPVRLPLHSLIIRLAHSTRQDRQHTGWSRVLRSITMTAVSAFFHNQQSGEGRQEATAVLSPFLRKCRTMYYAIPLRQHSG